MIIRIGIGKGQVTCGKGPSAAASRRLQIPIFQNAAIIEDEMKAQKKPKKVIAGGIVACRNIPVIYTNMPKSACSTIKNLLYRVEAGHLFADPLAIHRAIGKNLISETFVSSAEELDERIRNRNISFTFVRNPLSRIYSCFNEKIYYESKYSFPKLRNEYLSKEYSLNFNNNAGESYSAEQHSDNFRRFLLFVIDNIGNKTKFRKDAHWMPEIGIIRHFSRYLAIDFIGKVESFETDMRFVFERAGIQDYEELLKLKFNEGQPAPYKLEQIITDDIRKIVMDIYAEDYLMLGYG